MIQNSRMEVKKKEKPIISALISRCSDFIKISLKSAKCIFLASLRKVPPNFRSEHSNERVPGLHLEWSVFFWTTTRVDYF